MMNFFAAGASWMAVHWWVVLIPAAVGIAATCRACLETEEARAQRAQRNREKRLRALAAKISNYARKVHQRYPTGDVIVSQTDLAERLGKAPDAVITALNLLLREQKVQTTLMAGYWKLNV
jgi:galactitol-specific phosphotransferase system IIB component